ncbi:MAG: SpoVG family protein [Oscillospiraceae bacterium]|nr:SpoVG family protein [Oscillospiraceae bacterium]
MKIAVKIDRILDNPNSAVKAFASVTMDGAFAVHGLKIMQTEKGCFVAMPSNSYKDREGKTQYSDVFHAVTKAARDAIQSAVLHAYDRVVYQTQQFEVEEPLDEPEPAPSWA